MRFVDRKDIHNVYKAMEKMQRTFDKWTSNAWGGLQTISRVKLMSRTPSGRRNEMRRTTTRGSSGNNPAFARGS